MQPDPHSTPVTSLLSSFCGRCIEILLPVAGSHAEEVKLSSGIAAVLKFENKNP